MQENSIRRAVREGRAALGTGIKEFASRGVPWIIEQAGFDYCAIDHEHGAFDMETIASLASWFQATNVSAIVRLHKSFAHLIPGVLDQGIMGIQVSEVENAEEARAIVRLAKYPPIGNRGISGQGPHTGYQSYGRRHASEYAPWANDNIIVCPSIESLEGLENVEEIAAVAGIDMIAYGHSDLSAHSAFTSTSNTRRSKRQCGGSRRRALHTASSLGAPRRPRRRSRNIGGSGARS
jgi:2-keto-3-deoxy-L-rhamnonate aldolase RhmA